jgi:uncharacterized protein (TIGR02246 family)
MSSDASDAVRAATARINAAWQERRYDDLGQMFAEDMVFTLPGFSGRLEGRDAIAASYREFMERARLTSYREEQLAVHVWGDTAIASYRWDMTWSADGVPNHETGHDIFAFRRANGAWLAIWRTMTFDRKSS